MAEHKYGKDEIQEILKKAAEKQQKSQSTNAIDVGLSLDEIERIAAEAGIDPRFVRAAALETSPGIDDREYSKILGGIRSMKVSRSIAASISPDELDSELIPVIRETMEKTGQFEKLGRTITWTDQATPASSYVTVKVSTSDKGTEVSAETTKNLGGVAVALMIMPTIFVVLSVIVFAAESADAPFLLFPLFFLASLLSTRFGYSYWTNRLEKQLDNVVDALEDHIADIGTEPAAKPEEVPDRIVSPTESRRLNIDSADYGLDDSLNPARRRDRSR